MYELNGFARTKGREMPQGRTLLMGAVLLQESRKLKGVLRPCSTQKATT